MTDDRHLHWEGCFNVRDLGGLPAAGGGRIRRGAIVRADRVDRLTAAGWSALEAHGVRTVIDLRNDDELGEDVAPRPAGIDTVRVALDGVEDTEFWSHWASGPWFGTPMYYRPFLDRAPQRVAAAMAAIARARPGGVLVHCAGGRDRTGLVTLLLLALAGVPAETIADDYALSEERIAAAAAVGAQPDASAIATWLDEQGTTAHRLVVDLVEALDAERLLLDAGLPPEDLSALRDRLVEPAG
jgi:protein-tyrosine phosphatase